MRHGQITALCPSPTLARAGREATRRQPWLRGPKPKGADVPVLATENWTNVGASASSLLAMPAFVRVCEDSVAEGFRQR